MTGFNIPNTPEAPVTQNQAEPDSLDFYIVGNRRSGVVSGMVVAPGSGTTVTVSSGEVLLNGDHYQWADGTTNHTLTAYSTIAFFDVVVARVNTTTRAVSILIYPGNQTTNPRYPSLTTAPTPGPINPETDIVLAAVWRDGSTVDAARITDKRILVNSNPQRKGGTPNNDIGQNSDLHVNTSWAPAPTGTNVSVNLASPLHVRVGGIWYNLAYWPSGGIPDITVTTSPTAPTTQGKNGDIWIRV